MADIASQEDSNQTTTRQPTSVPNHEDDILKYLLADNSPDFSSPDGSPLLVLDNDSTESDASPWRTDDVFSAVPTDLPDISIDLDTNPEILLYGTSFNYMDYNSFPMATPAASAPPVPIVPVEIVPAQQLVSPPKKSRSKKRPRASEPPPIPSPEKPEVSLPRDTLLQISSQGMERYVENLTSSRALSLDDQKELKRQKRLIKNRESAQLSRERKRAYIDQLEEKISQLVRENSLLKNENMSLRQALSQFQSSQSLVVPKIEVSSEPLYRKPDAITQHATKMAGLISNATTIGGNRPSATAKAGVCLLIVLFTFGLFMNSTTTLSPRSLLPAKAHDSIPEIVPYRSVANLNVGYKRNILEAFPEVMDEDGDDFFDGSKKQLTATENDNVIIPNKKAMQVHRQIIEHPIQVKPAGIYKVSYSPEPAKFLVHEPAVNSQGEHSHDKDDNSTYMLFLDPRPDLDNDVEIPAPSDSAPKSSDLQVSTHTHVKNVIDPGHGLPPMIISLVVPNHIANGSNPLFPKGSYNANSLMEITCQVVDVSITTAERPAYN